MKYIWTLIWTFLLVQMLGYVGSSMTGLDYSVKDISIIGVVVTVLILIVAATFPKASEE